MSTRSSTSRWLKKWFGYPVEALFVYALYGFFKVMPIDAASNVGARLGRFLGRRLGATKKARRNLAKAMPELSPAQLDGCMSEMWENLGRVLAEYPHLGELDESRIEVIGSADPAALYAARKPFFLVSGHFANWEALPMVAARREMILQLIYRHANNPYVDRLLAHARTPGGDKYTRKGAVGARSIHGALRAGLPVGMLIDQKHNRGLPIPFFGRPAMTGTAIAELALKYDAPIFVAQLERLEGARFRVTIDPALPMPPEGPNAVADILTRLNARLEQFIRARPGQWLWLHRRWSD